ncbi:MAG: hypothetical protein QOK40_524 [Miltoncostaeaceae bacterium]|jgi:hypothetical protein|nr:hypothetical protein [Miltoncostaeaceae bacterium]
MTIVYDKADAVQGLLRAGLSAPPYPAPDDGLYQQSPVRQVLNLDRMAGKVSRGAGSSATPTIRGLSPQQIAATLAGAIDASGAHLVFVDEPTRAALPPPEDGTALRDALLLLSKRPFGATTYARRVHVYVHLPAMIDDPRGWAAAYDALRLAGGVWVEAYEGPPIPARPWSAAQWGSWPRRLRTAFVARSADRRVPNGDARRLHLVLTASTPFGEDQSIQWRRARTGAACTFLANGPGAYRLSGGATGPDLTDPAQNPDLVGFAREFRAVFGARSAPVPADVATSRIACLPAP